MASSNKNGLTLVIGGTGATGRHVVYQLLEQNRPVHVIVRSKERMVSILKDLNFCTDKSERNISTANDTADATALFPLLTITEASIVDMTDQQLHDHCSNADNVVCCLGHNMTLKGMYGHPRRFVSETVQRLCKILAQTTGQRRKFIVMTSDGVPHPSDDPYGFWTRCIMGMIRRCVPPHADNEAVGTYLYNLIGSGNMEWIMVRPTNLVNGPITKYVLHDKPVGGLFGNQVVSRANVAKYMVDLITNDVLFKQYKFRMPVIHDDPEYLQKRKRKGQKVK